MRRTVYYDENGNQLQIDIGNCNTLLVKTINKNHVIQHIVLDMNDIPELIIHLEMYYAKLKGDGI